MNKVDFPVVSHVEIHDGQARIVGRNVKVKMVISRLIHGAGATIEAVMEQYALTRSEVLACLEYYYDHQAAIDNIFELEDAELAQTALPSSEWKARLNTRRDTGESSLN